MKRHLAITGFMGSGKTTLAQKIAKQAGLPLIDLDHYIEQKEKKTILQIFEEAGESCFREMEKKYLDEVVGIKGSRVIALGGGTICFNNTLEVVKQNCWLIALMPAVEVLLERLWNEKDKRPLLKNITTKDALKQFIEKKLNERKRYYTQADLII